MHIGYVTIDFHSARGGGGIASYLQSVAAALVGRGHQVTVISLSPKPGDEWRDGIRIVGVRAPNVHWYLYRLLPFGKSLNLPVREVEWSWRLWQAVAAIHKQTPLDVVETGETAVLASRFVGGLPPIVVRGHGNSLAIERSSGRTPGWMYRLTRKLELVAIRRAAMITAVSKFQAQELAIETQIPLARIQVIPNPVNEQFGAVASPVTDNPPPSASAILYTGRIEVRKGTLVLLEAMAIVFKSCPTAQLVVVGGRHASITDAMLETELSRLAIKDKVVLAGHVPWQRLGEWYRRATVFVMPSFYETFGISVVEAMAFGLPVVATTAGGLPEVVADGITGQLVPPGDGQALAEAIIALLRDPERRQRMGQAGHERVMANFTVDKVVEQTLAVYKQAARVQ